MSSLSRILAGFFGAIALCAQPAAQLPANHPISIWLGSLRETKPGTPAADAYTLKNIGSDRSESARALLGLLKDPSPDVRGYAATALGQFRLAPKESVPALIQLFLDKDDFVREHAALAVAAFGKEAVPDLIKALDWEPGYDKAPSKVRTLATYGAIALVEIGPSAVDALLAKPDDVDANLYALFVLKSHASHAVSRLREQLRSKDEKTRIAAMKVLDFMASTSAQWDMPAPFVLNPNPGDWREVVPLLLDRLASSSLTERRTAAQTLEELGPMESELRLKALPPLLHALDDPDEAFEISVLGNLKFVGNLGEVAVARVAKLYRNSKVRRATVETLASIGRNSQIAAVTIAKGASDPDVLVRREAVDALAKLGPASLQFLLKALQDKDPGVRETAVESLGALGPNAAASVPALIALLRDTKQIQSSVIKTLRKIGPDAAAAIPELLAVLEGNGREMGNIVLALANMGSPGIDAIQRIWERADEDQQGSILDATKRGGKNPALAQWLISLYSPDSKNKDEILRAVASVGPATLDFFAKALKDPHPEIRVAAAKALSNIANNSADSSGAAALSTLLTVADDPEPKVRAAAATLLPSAGPATLPLLRKALSDPDETVRYAAADSLGYGAPGTNLDDATLHGLAEALGDEDLRMSLLEALGRAGSRASFAVAAIVPLLHDKSQAVREAAADALAAIGTFPPEAANAVNLQIMDSYITNHVQEMVADIENDAGPMVEKHRKKKGPAVASDASGPAENVEKLPALPWPMPQPSAWAALDKTLLGRDATALKDVEAKLAKALVATGFSEPGIFSAPSGFALLAQVERIHEDGTPYSPPDRWSSGKLALRSFSLKDYLSSLFFDTPGEFRLFVFIITTGLNPVKSDATLPQEAARNLAAKGGRILPDAIGNLTLKDRNCFVLVYQFQREQGQFTTLSQNGISALEHMQKAGIARAIQ